MTQTATVTSLADLPALTQDEIDDACFNAQDLAWAKLVEAFEVRRESEGLTYKELGDRIGRSKSQVQRWLGSAFGMNIRSLGLLAEGLDVDLKIALLPREEVAASVNFAHPVEVAKIDWERSQWLVQTTPAYDRGSLSMPVSPWSNVHVPTIIVGAKPVSSGVLAEHSNLVMKND